MSQWGVFDKVSPPHVMPVDAVGFAVNGHMVSDRCWCQPYKEERGGIFGEDACVIVHNDKGRGGRDA